MCYVKYDCKRLYNKKNMNKQLVKTLFNLIFICVIIISCQKNVNNTTNLYQDSQSSIQNENNEHSQKDNNSNNNAYIRQILLGTWYETSTFVMEGEGRALNFAGNSTFWRGSYESEYKIEGSWSNDSNFIYLTWWEEDQAHGTGKSEMIHNELKWKIEIIDQDNIRIIEEKFITDYTKEGAGTKKLLENENEHLIINTIITEPYLIPFVTFSPDGKKLLSFVNDDEYGRIILWDVESGNKLWSSDAQFNSNPIKRINSAAFSPDGREIVSGGMNRIIYINTIGRRGDLRLWNTETGIQILEFEPTPRGEVSSFVFNPDGSYFITATSSSGDLMIYEKESGHGLTFVIGESEVNSLALSPDGNQLLIGYNSGALYLFSIDNGSIDRYKLVKRFSRYSNKVFSIFSPDGSYVLSREEGTSLIKLWKTETGDEIRTFSGHRSKVNSIAFSPDGSMILSGSGDRSIKLWDTATGELIRTYTGHSREVSSAAFSPDGKFIASSSHDGSIKIWELDIDR
jgi:WD40 repeat protein